VALLTVATWSALGTVPPVDTESEAEMHAGPRPVTVADAIRMTTLGNSSYSLGEPSGGRVGQFSPDRHRVVVIVRKGDLASNANRYSILLWKANRIPHSPKPEVLLTMSSSSSLEAIADVTWDADNETLIFLGQNGSEPRQVYAFNVRAHVLTRLTQHSTNIVAYSRTSQPDRIAFIAEAPFESLWDEKAQREGVLVSSQWIPDLIGGRKGYHFRGLAEERELFLWDAVGERRVGVTGRLRAPLLSPDGKHVVVAASVPTLEIPPAWQEYSASFVRLLFNAATNRVPMSASLFERYVMVDALNGESHVLLNSPLSSNAQAAWLPDGHSVMLINVFLPLEGVGADEKMAREKESFAVRVNIFDGTTAKIGLPKRQQKHDDRRLKLVVKESMNTSPKLYVRRSGRDPDTLLLDLNPWFRNLRLGRVEEIEWEWAPGRTIKGGVYYPPDYAPGRKYPLLIQTHAWDPERFWIDGPWRTGYAAQPLAARHVMVLQLQDAPFGYGVKEEGETAIAIYESAIHELARRGLVSADRVGLLGFSHTCFLVKYALTHSRYKFAAAAVAEGEDGGYIQFMTNGNAFVDPEVLYGGPPFGRALRTWVDVSPGFNIDRVDTPLRIVVLNPRFLLGDWEWFEALKLLGKPVEMVMLQNGEHDLQKPWDRMISQGGNVDWFDFWLNGHEDPGPAKAEQYARWRKLREMRKANEAAKSTTQ